MGVFLPLSFSPPCALSFFSHPLIILFFFCFFWGCFLRRTANIWAQERYSLPQFNAVCTVQQCLYVFPTGGDWANNKLINLILISTLILCSQAIGSGDFPEAFGGCVWTAYTVWKCTLSYYRCKFHLTSKCRQTANTDMRKHPMEFETFFKNF